MSGEETGTIYWSPLVGHRAAGCKTRRDLETYPCCIYAQIQQTCSDIRHSGKAYRSLVARVEGEQRTRVAWAEGDRHDVPMRSLKTRQHQSYDHRLKTLFHTTGDPELLVRFGVPRSTLHGWSKHRHQSIVTADVLDLDRVTLQAEVLELRERVRKLGAVIAVLLALLRASGIRLDKGPLPEGEVRARLLRVIERTQKVLSLSGVLRLLHLSAARYHHWKREGKASCEVQAPSKCPRRMPNQLTLDELAIMREMAESPDYRHVPTGRLAILAQRLGKVFAASATWCKQVRKHVWRRPRKRVYPAKPKVGQRASKPNELWHVDLTIIKLLDGTKVYLHAVIDNFSRRILAWCIATHFNAMNTVTILQQAARQTISVPQNPVLVVDAGVENLNKDVDDLIEAGWLSRVVALRDVLFSNSMIEAFWRTLKHQWLYLNTLDSVEAVQRLVAFYVHAHNTELPHAAFCGQTPDEMYFGIGNDIPDKLDVAKREARIARIKANRAVSCRTCQSEDATALPVAA